MKEKDWLAETTNNMLKNQNCKLRAGQTIRVGFGERANRVIKTGIIEKLEKHYIVVNFDKYKESYSYVDIITSLYSDREEYKFLIKEGKEWTRITKEMIRWN